MAFEPSHSYCKRIRQVQKHPLLPYQFCFEWGGVEVLIQKVKKILLPRSDTIYPGHCCFLFSFPLTFWRGRGAHGRVRVQKCSPASYVKYFGVFLQFLGNSAPFRSLQRQHLGLLPASAFSISAFTARYQSKRKQNLLFCSLIYRLFRDIFALQNGWSGAERSSRIGPLGTPIFVGGKSGCFMA